MTIRAECYGVTIKVQQDGSAILTAKVSYEDAVVDVELRCARHVYQDLEFVFGRAAARDEQRRDSLDRVRRAVARRRKEHVA